MKLLRQTVRVAVPAILESLSNSAILLVDALMVASLGPTPLAAAGLVGVVLWRLRALGSVLQIGTGATVARRWGGGQIDAARIVFTHGAVLGSLVGCLWLLFFPFAMAIFGGLNARGDVLLLAAGYFQAVVICFPLRLSSTNMAASLRAAGDTKTPMMTTLIINVANIVLNYTLIFGNFGAPALGLVGAGIATSLSFALEFVILAFVGWRGIRPRRMFQALALELPVSRQEEMGEISAPVYPPAPVDPEHAHVLRFSREGFRLRIPGVTRSILRISHPSFWEEIAVSLGFLVFIAMIAELGEAALAAHTAVTRIESFSFNAGFGVSVAAATIVGQALGAGSLKDARRVFSLTLTLGVVIMGSIGILFALEPEWFLKWFVAEEGGNFLPLATTIFLLAALEQPFIGAAMVLAGGLRGAGMTMAPFFSQLFCTVGIRIGFGWYFGFHLGWGLEGLYWATVLDWLCRTVILSVIVMGGRWEKMEI